MSPRAQLALLVVCLLLLIVAPAILATHHIILLTLIATTSIITVGLSVVTGLAGQITLGQAAFCAFGAYGSTLLAQNAGVPMWASIPAATLISAAIGDGFG